MNTLMALPNLIALLFLGREVKKIHNDYFTECAFSIANTID
ncbi:MAG TPA: hypothetical protein VMZ04_05465 [Anaerolineae bacterium]|nr:hypothetical protein [Anaerolineae bacterium]